MLSNLPIRKDVSYFLLANKVAVITGGGLGIVLATAKRFDAAGAVAAIIMLTKVAALEFGPLHLRVNSVSFVSRHPN